MKLISKYKDYYDHFAKNPSFSENSWNRVWRRTDETVPVDFQIPACPCLHFIPVSGLPVSIKCFNVFFCGDEFPCVEIEKLGSSYQMGEKTFYYSPDIQLPPAVYKFSDSEIKGFFDIQHRRWLNKSPCYSNLPRLTNLEMHRKLGTPVFMTGGSYTAFSEIKGNRFNKNKFNVLINPVLKDLGFGQVVNDFDCFQKIESFIANELVQPDIIDFKVPDKLNAESHGFDEFSFRKEQTSKRKNRKE